MSHPRRCLREPAQPVERTDVTGRTGVGLHRLASGTVDGDRATAAVELNTC